MGVAIKKEQTKRRAAQYEADKDRRRRLEAEKAAAGQEIGDIPKIVKPHRRRKAIKSFAYFCETYFPQAFTLPWSEYHVSAAHKIERAVLAGGQFGFAMPRGSGKTTMCEWAVLWASLCGHSPYTVLIAASESTAEKQLRNIKTTLATNELLYEDFPEVLHAIKHLDNSSRKAEGQRHNGQRTGIAWQARRIVLPTIWRRGKMTKASGGLIEIYGLTGEIRGGRHTRMDGSVVRPRLAICDDPQTRESARSASQTQAREATLAGDVAYLAGPGKPIAVVMPCTVIYRYDLADNMLDREKHPEWQGERTSMVESFPDNNKLWDEYADILYASLRSDGDKSQATQFYKDNRDEMDAGAKVSWEHRFNDDELSAVQHAMNLKIRDEDTFWAECQNEPSMERSDLRMMSSDEIQEKLHGFSHRVVPSACSTITSFVDVHRSVLYWCVTAWDPNFTGYIIDYGTYPEQGARQYYTLENARNTIQTEFPDMDDEGSLFASLGRLIPMLAQYEWQREDGASMHVNRMLIDCNWGNTSELVNSAMRQSPHAAILTPYYGRGIKASGRPISQWAQTRKFKSGPEWMPTKPKGGQMTGVFVDVNYWKKRFFDALQIPLGSRGSVSLFRTKRGKHRMFADHLCSERPVKTTCDTRVVYEWNLTPGADNHFLDAAVGTMVAASVSGIVSEPMKEPPHLRQPTKEKRKKRKWRTH